METTTNSTNTFNATTEFLNSQIAQKDQRIAQLEESHARVVQRDFSTAAALTAMSTSLQEWTLSQFEDGGINEEQATELSEIGNFDLTKEVEAEVTVKYWITLQVPAGESAEDLINDIDFESVSYNSDKVTYITTEVTDIDF